jgi:antitoxin ParD1/3/4
MGEMTYDFPPALQRWIEQRLAEGRFANEADYFRDLVRRDQEGLLPEEADTPEYVAWVREKVAEGLASGVIHRDPRDALDEIVATRHARRTQNG